MRMNGIVRSALVAIIGLGGALAQGASSEGESRGLRGETEGADAGPHARSVPYLFPLEGSKRWVRWQRGVCEDAYLDRLIGELMSPTGGEGGAERKLCDWLCLCDVVTHSRAPLDRRKEKVDAAFRWYERVDLSKAGESRRRAAAALLGERVGVDEAWVRKWCEEEPVSVVEAWRAIEWCLFNANKEVAQRVLARLVSWSDRRLHPRDHIVLRTRQDIEHLWLCTLLTAATVARREGVDGGGHLRLKLRECLCRIAEVPARLQAVRLLLSLGRVQEARRELGARLALDSDELREMHAAVLRELARHEEKAGR